MANTSADITSTEDSYLPHLRELGFPYTLCVANVGDKNSLCKSLGQILREAPRANQKWSFSYIGPLEERKNLTVLTALSNRWPDVGIHLSEMFKSEEQAMTFCEIAFTAPLSFVEELLRNPNLDLEWNSKLCGWLLDSQRQKDLLLEFKTNNKGFFTIPTTEIEIGFAASDDWECIEFFASKEKLLKIQDAVLK
jgi:hypothetical protein